MIRFCARLFRRKRRPPTPYEKGVLHALEIATVFGCGLPVDVGPLAVRKYLETEEQEEACPEYLRGVRAALEKLEKGDARKPKHLRLFDY